MVLHVQNVKALEMDWSLGTSQQGDKGDEKTYYISLCLPFSSL